MAVINFVSVLMNLGRDFQRLLSDLDFSHQAA
jgi:hypothetical protein